MEEFDYNYLYNDKHLSELEEKLNYYFQNKELLVQALLHSSYKGKEPNITEDNEKLEFLGDSVLNFIIATDLYNNFKESNVGFLSKVKNELVSKDFLNLLGRKIGVEYYIFVASENILKNKGIVEDTMEALFGAIFLDSGINGAIKVILTLYGKYKAEIMDILEGFNAKQILQEYFIKNFQVLPTYEVQLEPSGNIFRAQIIMKNKVLAEGLGKNKKEAEKEAAYYLCKKFGLL